MKCSFAISSLFFTCSGIYLFLTPKVTYKNKKEGNVPDALAEQIDKNTPEDTLLQYFSQKQARLIYVGQIIAHPILRAHNYNLNIIHGWSVLPSVWNVLIEAPLYREQQQ